MLRKLLISTCCILICLSCFAYPTIEGIQDYRKNFHFSETLKQRLASDINRFHHADNMWELLQSEFTLSHYEDRPEVQEQLDFFMNNRNFLLHCAQRAAPYLYYISEQVKKRHLPAEIVLLPMIESAYNPFAYSSAGAGGIWQMMPNTASGFGIKQNWWYDGRRDVIASTKAALNYLVYLGGFFDGNWLLALAAYNTGEGNVLAAIHRNVQEGKSTSFWSLPLPQQTREYVPRLLALAIIIAHPEEYPMNFPAVHNAPYLAQVDVGGQIELSDAAYFAGLSTRFLKQLNPGHNRNTTDPHGPYQLILPIQNVQQFTENFMRSSIYASIQAKKYMSHHNQLIYSTKKKSTPLVSSKTMNFSQHYSIQPGDTIYIARKGDTLKKISHQFHLSILSLLAANKAIKTNGIKPEMSLIIPTHINNQKHEHHNSLATKDIVYIVRPNDTVEKIAKKFNLQPYEIRLANLLRNDVIHTGDRIVIPTHV